MKHLISLLLSYITYDLLIVSSTPFLTAPLEMVDIDNLTNLLSDFT